ncbi:amino acid synthesis family protein [Frigidibacter sp.]|uniref:amino acid synthesis family protein n=1 Tax=Frigidibacter sp. TaxID=2586418 RepID=UPI0027372B6C|nr:amino acid synthesis family protein [Frigidibacter sp.]MDP3342198.1 amino acid synthesis family protein [Frigidibacter sp.]
MIKIECRKIAVFVEDIWHDGGKPADRPLRKGAVAAVVANPYAGRYVEELGEWVQALDGLGAMLAQRLLDALGLPAEQIESFGKGTIVGVHGEIETGAAWHAPGGAALKRLLGVRGFVSAGQIIGNAGDRLHIPLVSVHSPWVRSHFDGIDISVADGPRPNEILFALAISNGGRIHARLGGLTFAEGARGEGPKF